MKRKKQNNIVKKDNNIKKQDTKIKKLITDIKEEKPEKKIGIVVQEIPNGVIVLYKNEYRYRLFGVQGKVGDRIEF